MRNEPFIILEEWKAKNGKFFLNELALGEKPKTKGLRKEIFKWLSRCGKKEGKIKKNRNKPYSVISGPLPVRECCPLSFSTILLLLTHANTCEYSTCLGPFNSTFQQV